jgi:cytidine deaminase
MTKLNQEDKKLIGLARHTIVRVKEKIGKSSVGCALITENNKIHSGISLRGDCGIGFCAENSAISSMITSGETHIKKIVSVVFDGRILPPCGKCRELIYQLNKQNLKTEVIVSKTEKTSFNALLPNIWQKQYKNKP